MKQFLSCFSKTLRILPTIILIASFLSAPGCAKKQKDEKASKEEQKTLEIWGMGIEGDRLKDIIQFYKEENPDVEITVQSIPWGQAHEKIITAVAGGLTPDLCQFGTTWIPEFVELDALEPLDDYVANSQVVGESKYFPGSWKTGFIKNQVYGIPWYVDTRVLFYRKDLLKAAGFDYPPRTWDELKTICRKLIKKNDKGEIIQQGITLPGVDWMVLAMFMWSNGGDIMSPTGEVIINSPENREALEFYVSFFNEELASRSTKGGVSLYNDFKSGYIPMFIGGSWMLEDLHRHVPEIEGAWDVAVLPRKKGGTSFVGGSNWCVFKASKKKERAWDFIEFMSRPETQIKWFELTTDLPTQVGAWEDKFFNDKPMIKVFGQQLSDTQSPPKVQEWEEISMRINVQMERAVFGKATSEEALAIMEKDIKEILSRKR